MLIIHDQLRSATVHAVIVFKRWNKVIPLPAHLSVEEHLM